MRFAQLGAVATLAGLSQGFLVPPEISSADKDIITTLPFEDAVGIDGRVMEINCPGCPLVTDLEGKMHITQTDSILQLNFSISHENGANQLLLNGVQIYPMNFEIEKAWTPLTAPQMVKSSTDDTWQYAATPQLGYVYSTRETADPAQDQLLFVSIHFEINIVADKFVSGLPSIDLKLLETPSGKLMIGEAEITAPTTPASPTDDAQECTTLLCKWRAIVADRLRAMKGSIAKGCGKKRPAGEASAETISALAPEGHRGPEVRPVFIPKKPHFHHGRPRPHGGHRVHHHRHRHGFARFLRGIVLHVFIPVLIGIMVGITASLIGMVVGHIVIFTWRMLFRRGQRKYTEVKQEEVEEDSEDESKGFLEHQGPPPQYDDAIVEKKEDSA